MILRVHWLLNERVVHPLSINLYPIFPNKILAQRRPAWILREKFLSALATQTLGIRNYPRPAFTIFIYKYRSVSVCLPHSVLLTVSVSLLGKSSSSSSSGNFHENCLVSDSSPGSYFFGKVMRCEILYCWVR